MHGVSSCQGGCIAVKQRLNRTHQHGMTRNELKPHHDLPELEQRDDPQHYTQPDMSALALRCSAQAANYRICKPLVKAGQACVLGQHRRPPGLHRPAAVGYHAGEPGALVVPSDQRWVNLGITDERVGVRGVQPDLNSDPD
jgi:hypothetical protein